MMPLPPAIEHYLAARRLDARPHEHTSVPTSRALAALEGLRESAVAKVAFFHCDGQMALAVLPANRVLHLALVRLLTGCDAVRLAGRDEIAERIGAIAPEAAPPFGSLFGMPVFLDELLLENDLIEVPAGDFTHSLALRMEDYLREETPVVLELSRPEKPPRSRRRRESPWARHAGVA